MSILELLKALVARANHEGNPILAGILQTIIMAYESGNKDDEIRLAELLLGFASDMLVRKSEENKEK